MECKNLDTEAIKRGIDVLKALAHPDRLRIIQCLINRKKLTVSDLMQCVRSEQAVVSKHLAILKRSGIVRCEVKKNYRFYSISEKRVIKVLKCVKGCR